MKKLLCLLSLGALLTFCACNDDDNDANTSGDLAQVTFTLETTGGIETRAYSDGLTATYLVYGVYDSKTEELVEGLSQTTAVSAFSNKTATVQLYLPKGGSYTIVFWAQAEDPPYTVDLENKTVTLTGDTDEVGALTVAGNDETMDAFYATVETGTVTGNYSESVTLKRPFAQVNVGADDYSAYQAAGKEVKYTKLVVTGAGNTLNLLDGTVTFGESTAGGTVIYDWALVDESISNTYPYEKETDEEGNVISPTVKDDEYTYLSMNYVFVGADMTTVDVEFYFSESDEEEDNHSVSVSSVPIQRNYRTNIYGSLLTGTFTYNLEIDETYDGEYNNMVAVSSSTDLIAALKAGNNVILTSDIEAATYTTIVYEDATIDLNGYTLTFTGSGSRIQSVSDDVDITVTNGTIVTDYYAVVVNTDDVSVTLDDVTVTSSSGYAVYLTSNATDATLTVENSTLNATTTYGRGISSAAADATITLSETEINATYLGVYASGDGTTITATDVTVGATTHSAYFVDAEDATVTITGGYVSDAYYYGIVTWSDYNTLTVSGTTFTDCGYNAIALLGDYSTLDVDDCVITATEEDLNAYGILIGMSSGTTTGNTVSVTGTTIDLDDQIYGIGIFVYGYENDITVEDCIIKHNYFGITQNGTSTPGSTFTVKNSIITGPYTGIYLSMSTTSSYYNTLNVSGSTIISTESTPIEVKKTYLMVSGSNLTSQYAGEEDDDDGSNKQQDYSFFGSGSAGSGYGIVLAGYKTGQAYSYDFTDLASAVSLSDITYTLSVQYAMDGQSDPWYVLQYMGYEEDSTESDYSAEYTDNGATSNSSYSSSDESTTSAPRHKASSRSSLPQLRNHEVEARQVTRTQYKPF